MKNYSPAFLLLLLLLFVGREKPLLAQNSQPNILFIYTDDQAYWSLGISGNPQAYSPHLDALAMQGAFFENAFVTTPVCSPSRASLMTGRYASEFGIVDFIPQPGHKLYDPENPIGLAPGVSTFPKELQKQGYQTGLVGKWHLGDWTDSKSEKGYHPTNQGYDYFMGLTGGGESPVNPTLEEGGKIQQFQGLTVDILTERALHFMETHRKGPFLLSVHYRSPHSKWLPVARQDWMPFESMEMQAPHPDFPDLDVEKVQTRMKEYLASAAGVDRSVGLLLEKLKALGLEENTIVIFTSDHGYNMGHNGIEHKGNGYWITKTDHPATANLAKNSRPNLYDQSVHVPLIVRWPGVVEPGLRITETVSNLDWYPTILEMAGVQKNEIQKVKGRSMVSLLKGQTPTDWENELYLEYSMIYYSTAHMRAYRTPEWKLVQDFQDPTRNELYHLKEDPEEKENLFFNDSPEIQRKIKELSDRIQEKMRKTQDPLANKSKSLNGIK